MSKIEKQHICEWCGDLFELEEDLIEHKKMKHCDYGADKELSILNKEIASEERTKKKEESIEEPTLVPITEEEVRRIMTSNLSDLSSIEILKKLDQGKNFKEQLRILDMAKKYGIKCRKKLGSEMILDLDGTNDCLSNVEKDSTDKNNQFEKRFSNPIDEPDVINPDWDDWIYLENVKLEDEKETKNGLDRNNINKGNGRCISRKRGANKKRTCQSKSSITEGI